MSRVIPLALIIALWVLNEVLPSRGIEAATVRLVIGSAFGAAALLSVRRWVDDFVNS